MNHLINELLTQEIIDELNIPDFNDFIISRCQHHLHNIQFNTELKPRYNKGYISDNSFEQHNPYRCTVLLQIFLSKNHFGIKFIFETKICIKIIY